MGLIFYKSTALSYHQTKHKTTDTRLVCRILPPFFKSLFRTTLFLSNNHLTTNRLKTSYIWKESFWVTSDLNYNSYQFSFADESEVKNQKHFILLLRCIYFIWTLYWHKTLTFVLFHSSSPIWSIILLSTIFLGTKILLWKSRTGTTKYLSTCTG